MTRTLHTMAAGLMLMAATAAGQSAPPAQAHPGTSTPPAADPAPDPQAGYSYDPAGRRDPFVSLVRRGTDSARSEPGTRPTGLAGVAVGELTLRGTMESQKGYVALVQGPDLKTYIVKPGDRLFDGTIRAISGNAMVLMQQVNDPLSLEKEREVRKVLRQADEVK